MNVAYPLTTQIDHTELKFSLRTIEKFLKKPYDVLIIGDHMPEWLTGVTQIHVPDLPGRPMLSVRRKILAALHYAGDIIYMNDDIYLLQKTNTFPYYSSGVLRGKGESGANQTLKELEVLNKPVKYYGHYPCVYKKDFIEVLEHFSDDSITKSAYCNFIEVESIEIPDCKILTARKPEYLKEFIKGKPCFSTGLQSIKLALPVLEELFPQPSKYEV